MPAVPKVVCVGGGHGLAAALGAARQLTDAVTAVVTVADDGGSSGILRRQLGIPAPGDLRMAVAALAGDAERAGLIQYRFKEGELAGHPLGNLLIAALADLRADFAKAVREVAALAGVRGRVLPVTSAPVTLAAITRGVEVRGQVRVAQAPGPVERLWLEPADAPANPDALQEIEAADLVVLGPGSLFTSVIATLIVPGVAESVPRARRVVLVLNLAQQTGETTGMDGAAHVRALLAHCPGMRLDAVLVDGGLPGAEGRGGDETLPRAPVQVEPAAFAEIRAPLVVADLRAAGATHDPDKLAATLKTLIL